MVEGRNTSPRLEQGERVRNLSGIKGAKVCSFDEPLDKPFRGTAHMTL